MLYRLFALLLVLLLACPLSAPAEVDATASPLYVRKVENLPEDFIFGMDASSVLAEEASGVVYRDAEGNPADVFQVLADAGVTHIRVRVWNDPFDSQGHGYGGGNCDIHTAVEIGRRASACGLGLIVDFHYSDFWADPGKQMVPKAWAGMTIEQKTEAVYQYTRSCLELLKEAGVDVAMVQTGNETNNLLCGEKTWFNIQYLMQAGARATREVFPSALVALHFANPEREGAYATYAKKMDYYQVDYDVFATSYYPYWHGTLDNLAAVLTEISQTYGKKVMVMETSYAWTPEDSDFFGNTVGDGGTIVRDYPFTVQGQANSVRNITDTLVSRVPGAIGVVYWEGTWISVGTSSWEENHEKWETFGSGWASSYAATYDPADAGKYYGGCAVDNQALFDPSGRPLDSLQVFRLMRTGNDVPVVPDALEDVSLVCDLALPVVLPDTVNAVMNDNSRQPVPVVWDFSTEQEAAMRAAGPAQYEILGQAGGMEAHAWVSMVYYNYLRNDSFEEGEAAWTFTDLAHADELYVEDKKTDSLSGTKHAHFWSAARDSVEFTLEQRVEELPAGRYSFSISIMGGDAGDQEIYAYVKEGDQVLATAPMSISSYGSWDTGLIPAFDHAEGEVVTVGVYVRCQGAGNGAWGKIDDAKLNAVP